MTKVALTTCGGTQGVIICALRENLVPLADTLAFQTVQMKVRAIRIKLDPGKLDCRK